MRLLMSSFVFNEMSAVIGLASESHGIFVFFFFIKDVHHTCVPFCSCLVCRLAQTGQ